MTAFMLIADIALAAALLFACAWLRQGIQSTRAGFDAKLAAKADRGEMNARFDRLEAQIAAEKDEDAKAHALILEKLDQLAAK